jgi:hypothetical protein
MENPRDTRRTGGYKWQGGTRRDTRGTGGDTVDPIDTRGTEGRESRYGGIGAGRKAARTQQRGSLHRRSVTVYRCMREPYGTGHRTVIIQYNAVRYRYFAVQAGRYCTVRYNTTHQALCHCRPQVQAV